MRYADNKFVSNPGERYHVLYAPAVDKDGNVELVESGKEDLRELINSYAESCDISLILARVSQGDFSPLNVSTGFYGDFSSMPKTYAEFLQLQIDSNNLFQKLPAEVRARFGHDPNQFLAQAGTEEWQAKLGDVLPPECRVKSAEQSQDVKTE